MRWSYVFLALFVTVLFAASYVRFTAVTAASAPRPDARGPGDYPSEGGFYAVRTAGAIDKAKLEATIREEPRTIALEPGVFVSRSAIWSFPDITHVWEEDGHLHIASHLVYGRSDLGVNQRRVLRWLAASGA